MKQKLLVLIGMLTVISLTSLAGIKNVKESFKVSGNCGMCEKKIETAAKAVEGVAMADWDKKTKVIQVTYDAEKTNLKAVHKAIAKVGYDTDKVKADDAVYGKLHSCCKYKRK